MASPGAGTECTESERPGVHRCPPSLSSMGGLQPSLGQTSRRRRPVPLGGEFPSRSSFSRNGPEGVGGPLFPGTPAPLSLPSCWVGGAVEGSRLNPGPGKTSERVRGPRNAGSLIWGLGYTQLLKPHPDPDICSQRRPRLAPSWPPCPLCLGPEEGAVWGLEGSWQRGRGTVKSVSHSCFRGSTLHRAPLIPKR